MKQLFTLFIAVTLCALNANAQNSCSSALAVTAGTYHVDTIDGNEIPVPICANTGVGAVHSEWYKYTPTADHTVTITTDLPQNAGGDTRLNVYHGNCGSLECVVGADDQGSVTLAVATFQVSGGLTYRFNFDDRWSAAGFDFTILVGPPVVTTFNFVQQPVPNGSSDCVVDMNGDGLDDIVVTSSTLISIAHQQSGGGFTVANITTAPVVHTASWSIAAGDIDNNGYRDLLYGSGSGASFMVAGPGGTSFTEMSFPQYIFCQRTNFVDINNDGHLDGFSCHDVGANVGFINDGLGNLTFTQGGFGTTCGNYGSIWVDYDNDHDMDLFIAKCGCDPLDLLMRNNGDGTFTNVAPMLGLSDDHQSWSSAWGDFDNDGDMDMLIGSSGSTYHKLMRNDGGTFTNVTAGSGFDTFTGTSIQWTTHDFNNDGFLDILGGGALMLGHGNFTFTQSTATSPYSGPVGDLNNDGFLDIVSGSTIYMNTGNTNKHLTVNLVGTVSNRDGIGARITVTSAMGSQIREIRSGDAFSTMSSLMAHFGLGTDTEIQEVFVHWPSGIEDAVSFPAINSTLTIVEGQHPLGVSSVQKDKSNIYPNPAHEVLYLTSEKDLTNSIATVFDVTGQRVISTTLRNDRLDVSSLTNGVYMLEVQGKGELLKEKFIKN